MSSRVGSSVVTVSTVDSLVRVVKVAKVPLMITRVSIDLVPRSAELPGQRVLTDLRLRVRSDEWSSGDPLPTVAELAAHYEVARGTVARALKVLEAEGLVRVVPRWGTFKV
jgi:DNA-binding transcriptional ArsR family regulator